jgi:dTDP-4-dehydrorhamnose 3,5-epimerase-like enzyme
MDFSNLNIQLGSIEDLQIWTHQEFFDQRGFLTKTYDNKIAHLGGIPFLTSELYRMQENFCPECDFGLNLRNIIRYIPRNFEELILSDRDKGLPDFLPTDFRFRTHS